MTDPNHKTVLFSGKYEGIEAGQADQKFSKRIMIDLASLFSITEIRELNKQREEEDMLDEETAQIF